MSESKFEELTGKPIPADELSEAKKFADFDGKEQMMCGWQTVHRELHVIHTALLAVEKERDTLAAEAMRLREAMIQHNNCGNSGYPEKCNECAPVYSQTCWLKSALSSPATSNWSAAFEALVREHDGIEKHGWVPSDIRELSDAAESALAALKK